MYKHILIPTDGTPVADKAVAAGIEFAREARAQVTLFTAVYSGRRARWHGSETADVLTHSDLPTLVVR